MSAFKKAKAGQARLKMGLYGAQGTGKTFTALLFAEWLAKREDKRIAFVDTERGTDFYAMQIAERNVHPEAFDFDAVYTRSISETVEAVRGIDPNVHGVLIIDSITHLWEAAKAAYTGKKTSKGGIPVQAWGEIKKPYKELMSLFLDGDFHAIVCGREGVMMEEDDSGETVVVGKKMKSEGETPYEPHILLRFHPARSDDGGYITQFFCEKDRSGILTAKTVRWPTPAVIEPIYRYLGGSQAKLGTPEDAAARDAAAAEQAEQQKEAQRSALCNKIRTAILTSTTLDALAAAWELTSGKKGALGDTYYELVAIKDGRKAELLKVA